jgi:uroporphyrinogen decarboxylase
MRQAGRYLPEYRQTRAKVETFLELCYTPELAAEVTLQPLRRFELDAAILFSDILVIPDALGQSVGFETGEGPRLEPVSAASLKTLRLDNVIPHLAPVFETIGRVTAELPPDKAMLGFCGSPWTVATYMIAGRGSPDQAAARLFALTEPEAFARLIDILVEASVAYLIGQFRAGVDAVQLFESWALNLDEEAFRAQVIQPNRRIVAGVRAKIPDAAFIGFPRGAAGMVGEYAAGTGVDALGLDYAMPVAFAESALPPGLPVQGNLDPLRLVAGGAQLDERVEAIIAGFANRPHIFNLGHGIVPETPIEHVERLIRVVKGG